jgi:hypothetical protein
MRWLPVLGALCCAWGMAWAQTAIPTVDPAKALQGLPLVAQLRQGGYVLYMRHAASGPPTEHCKPQSGLTPEGETQARAVGAAIRTLKIPVGALWSSQTCRTEQTAQLLDLGNVQTTLDLNPGGGDIQAERDAARARRLLAPPAPGKNTLLVAHVQSAQLPQDHLQLAFAEVIVFRAGPQERPEPVARITLQDWPVLLSAVAD